MKHNKTLLIPGLGDEESLYIVKKFWKLRNRNLDTFDTRWATKENADDKFNRLCEFYESIDSKKVELICISAGGSLATQLLARYPEITKAIFISTKVKGSTRIGKSFQKRAPALLESVRASEIALQSADDYHNKVTIYRPLIDNIVPVKDMLVAGAKTKRVIAIGHTFGIGMALIFNIP